MILNPKINRTLIGVTAILILLFFSLSGQSAVLIKNKQWQKGMVLNVIFLDGNKELHNLVKTTAPQWLQNTSLSFKFYNNLAAAPQSTHIRISFNLHSGSQLGDHGDYLSKLSTMNLFDLTTGQISDSAAQRLILHEFGHALGFEHEYRSQYWPYNHQAIQQIIVACYPQMELIGYSKQSARTHCNEINAPVDPNLAFVTAYDESSIMNYPMSFIQLDGNEKRIKAALKLSLLDHHAIQQWYGK